MSIEDYQNAAYKDADDRGRITLGTEFSNTTVVVAWTDVQPEDYDDFIEPPKDERDKITELHSWAVENNYTPLDFDVFRGRIYTENAEWVDTDIDGLSKPSTDDK